MLASKLLVVLEGRKRGKMVTLMQTGVDADGGELCTLLVLVAMLCFVLCDER